MKRSREEEETQGLLLEIKCSKRSRSYEGEIELFVVEQRNERMWRSRRRRITEEILECDYFFFTTNMYFFANKTTVVNIKPFIFVNISLVFIALNLIIIICTERARQKRQY